MTEELEQNTEETTTSEESTVTESEQTALDGGWLPEAQWEGEVDEWVDAKTFNNRGELMDRIKSQTSQLKGQDKRIHKMQKAIDELAVHNKKVEENSYKKALADLKELKAEALSLSDYDQVVEIDDKIGELKDIQKESSQQPAEEQDTVTPEIEEWLGDNNWYRDDRALRGAFDGIAQDLIANNPALEGDVDLLLSKATQVIKKEFPAKFGRKATRQSVAEPNSTQESKKGGKSKYGIRHLNEEQRMMGQVFIDTGAFKTIEEYAQQLADINELDIQKGA